MNVLEDVYVVLIVKYFFFYSNVIIYEGSCVFFYEVFNNKYFVSFNIMLEDVMFFYNKFSMKGFVFFDMENVN